MDVGVTVRDETLHAVQPPTVILLVEGGLQHDALQVGTGIRFGQVHRHRFPGTYTRDEAAVLVFVAKFIQRFDTVLQRPDVSETGICGSHYLGTHRVRRNREVQPVILARHRHAVHTGLDHGVQVLHRPAGIIHTAVVAVRAFFVHTFGIRGNHIGRDVAYDVQHLIIRIHRVGIVHRRIIKFVLVPEVALFQFHNALHHRIL